MDEIKESAEAFFPQTVAWGAACTSCQIMLPALRDTAALFFETGSAPCLNCGAAVDVWTVSKNSIRSSLGTPMGLGELGANLTFFRFELAQGEMKKLDFTEHGVPPSAVVVSVNYTPLGIGCFPIEFHGNEARRRSYEPHACVYGASLGQDRGSLKVAVLVTWIDELEEPEAWTNLADAFQAATDSRFSRALVPAYSAFEFSLSRLVRELLLNVTSKNSVDEFMIKDLSAASALNVLLPFICRTLRVNGLPDDIRGKLNRLRQLRNKVLHESLRDVDVDKSEVGELLCAAVFGFEFVRYVRQKLSQSLKNGI